jgi:antitoxin PrlF
MLATLTSKGQITLPKEIRERLGLGAGSRLDFSIDEKGMLIARPVSTTALGLAGLLRQPGRKPATVEAMNEAIEQTAAELNSSDSP